MNLKYMFLFFALLFSSLSKDQIFAQNSNYILSANFNVAPQEVVYSNGSAVFGQAGVTIFQPDLISYSINGEMTLLESGTYTFYFGGAAANPQRDTSIQLIKVSNFQTFATVPITTQTMSSSVIYNAQPGDIFILEVRAEKLTDITLTSAFLNIGFQNSET